MNLLFVCSMNQWRSPTAEQIWRKHPELNVKSAGISSKARRTICVDDVRWADIIFVMEQKHKNRIKADFRQLTDHKTIHVLDIPDDYQYMDPELIEMLEDSVASHLPDIFTASSD